MNSNFQRRMASGCSYKSHLGISAIAAIRQGSDAFLQWAARLDTALGETSQKLYVTDSQTLPASGYLLYSNTALLFIAGAANAGHANMVLGGIYTTYHSEPDMAYNGPVTRAMIARWDSYVSAFRGRVDHAYVFGHSYGGACGECFCEHYSRLYPSTDFSCETYGSPRARIFARGSRTMNFTMMRNVHATDVVSHVPFHRDEAPLAAALADAPWVRAFDAAEHATEARVYQFDGTSTFARNNTIPVRDTTLSIVAWATYAQHINERQHELGTYLSTMQAAALADPNGTLPPSDVTVAGPPPVPTTLSSPALSVSGVAPSPATVEAALSVAEQNAMAAWLAAPQVKPARGIRAGGVSGVLVGGAVRVNASGLRSAKNLAKRLNRIRRLLGPLTTDQRSQILGAIEADFTGTG